MVRDMNGCRRINGRESSKSFVLVAVVVAGLLSVLILKYLWQPYIGLGGIWAMTCVYAAAKTKRSSAQMALLSLASIFFVLFLYETYLLSRIVITVINSTQVATDAAGDPQEMSARHEVLGYAPQPGQSGHFTQTYDGNTVYRYGYTIGSNGLRVSPPHKRGADIPCALFFGGSFTFGTGVEDDEALPYVAGILSEGKYRIYNFGYTGYGPHQMLAALENGLVDSIIECIPEVVIYQTMAAHSLRAAGLAGWDTHGPKYVLADTGAAVRHGNFDDVDNSFLSIVMENLKKSLTLTALGYNRYTNYKTDLMVAIVDKARNLVAERYPGSEFHVIIWDGCSTNAPEPVDRYLTEKIARKNFQLHLVSTIVVDICAKVDEYMIQGDGHPNKTAHDKIARYVVREIFRD